MKKALAIAVLALAGYGEGLYAQTRADRMFNMPQQYIYNTHTAHLQERNRIVIEMADATDYIMARNLDSIVRIMLTDIAIYKDSIQDMDNVRIDYVLRKGSDNTIMRLKKYKPEGGVYVKRDGAFSKLKLEQDTIRISLAKPLAEHAMPMSFYDFPVQITFLLNNYTELDALLNDKGLLNHIVDTFAAKSITKPYSPNISKTGTVIDYFPFKASKRMDVYRKQDEDDNKITARKK